MAWHSVALYGERTVDRRCSDVGAKYLATPKLMVLILATTTRAVKSGVPIKDMLAGVQTMN
jgi:hypothetical protein